ncbi:CHASE2 domain-containing protein [Methylomonas sp. HYX-M1]|uniref:CHASE2 domain-containing protein n=1 Tax=Methylomonas sp. HYX-M1 TaxID=3139307 RepID=UPI00345BD24C
MLNNRSPSGLSGYLPVAAIAVAGLMLCLTDPIALQLLRNATFDQFQRWQPRAATESPVRVVDIDDESLSRLGQWPWPRTLIADLLLRLQNAEPACISFDMIFAEPDRTSPVNMKRLWRLDDAAGPWLDSLPDHDSVLAQAVKRGRVSLGFALQADGGEHDRLLSKARFVFLGAPQFFKMPSYGHSISSLPTLQNAADGNGTLSVTADADGVIRRLPILMVYQNKPVPSLAAESLRVMQAGQNFTLDTRSDNGSGLALLKVGRISVPVNEQGEVWLHFSAHAGAGHIPAWKILQGQVAADELAGKLILIGTSAQGLMDMRFSPLGKVIAGIDMHAQVLEQILAGQHLLRPAWAASLEAVVLVIGSLTVGALALSHAALTSFLLFVLALAALWLAAWRAYADWHYLIDPMVPSLIAAAAFLLGSMFRHIYSERRQRWLKRAFSRYISPNLVEHLVRHPEALELGGRRQICSFVFTDLVDFTGLMEHLDPSDAVSLLNDYLENMIAIAFRHQGTLDRIVGDAVAIMFSAPVSQADHSCRAIACALDMQRFANEYCEQLRARGIEFGRTRIGVHSGEVIVGNFGGKTIFDYRALGDAVNTASRLEGANKYLGTLICVSEVTLAGCPGQLARPIGRILLKGKTLPLAVFELLATEQADEFRLAEYLAAYALLQQQDPAAEQAFRAILRNAPEDKLATFHLHRLQAGRLGDLIELENK